MNRCFSKRICKNDYLHKIIGEISCSLLRILLQVRLKKSRHQTIYKWTMTSMSTSLNFFLASYSIEIRFVRVFDFTNKTRLTSCVVRAVLIYRRFDLSTGVDVPGVANSDRLVWRIINHCRASIARVGIENPSTMGADRTLIQIRSRRTANDLSPPTCGLSCRVF